MLNQRILVWHYVSLSESCLVITRSKYWRISVVVRTLNLEDIYYNRFSARRHLRRAEIFQRDTVGSRASTVIVSICTHRETTPAMALSNGHRAPLAVPRTVADAPSPRRALQATQSLRPSQGAYHFASLLTFSSHPPRCCLRRCGPRALAPPRLLVNVRDPTLSSYPQCQCVLDFALHCRCEVSPCPGPQSVLRDSYPMLSGTDRFPRGQCDFDIPWVW